MLITSIDDIKAEFLKEFKRVGYLKSNYDLFKDFLTLSYTAICKATETGKEADDLEAEYMGVVKTYHEKDLWVIREMMPKLFALTEMGQYHKADFLGSIYHELEIHNKQVGQFFTPYCLCELTAQMTIQDGIEKIKSGKKKFFTLDEPAAGAGAMILACGNATEDAGLNPALSMFFQATDISEMAFKMCYVQTSLRGLSGFVRLGNSLSKEIVKVRKTPMTAMFYSLRGNPFEKSHYKKAIRTRENPRIKKL